MGKRSRKDVEDSEKPEKKEKRSSSKSKSIKSLAVDEAAVDPNLALLFATSAGPVKAPPRSRYQEPPPHRKQKVVEEESESEGEEAESEGDDEDLSSLDENLDDVDIEDLSGSGGEASGGVELDRLIEASVPKSERKRKRKQEEEDLEGKYLQKLAKEEEKEEAERKAERRLKRQRTMAAQDPDMSEESEDLDSDSDSPDGSDSEAEGNTAPRAAPAEVPLHESLAPSKDAVELEKASRTVFLANVSTLAMTDKAAKKTLLAHLGSFFPSIPALTGKPEHKVESVRFRSTAYAGTALPKKAAFAKKDLMSATTKSTNAYAVYSTAFAAREAVKKLNGTMVLDRHLRVDGVAHPAKQDHRRCVFVGNLGFVDDESMLEQGGENERKRSKIPSDVEEGLWRQFGKAGTVESVRVVRDEKTRVGKGFAYVQFEDANSVEAALLFNEKKYPPMLPRVLRVVRAKAVRKTALASAASRPDPRKGKGNDKPRIYQPKITSELSSLKGRAGKLLGKAGAAQIRSAASGANGTIMGKKGDGKASDGIAKSPETIVFEGYRASSKNGKPKDLKIGGTKKGKGKPKGRSSIRASSWKNKGGKKTS